MAFIRWLCAACLACDGGGEVQLSGGAPGLGGVEILVNGAGYGYRVAVEGGEDATVQ